ncbi:1149_t:CDS:1, partial [Racocetra fulgida]
TILIPDSDDDELPSLKTVLKNITNFTSKKINRKYDAEFIEIHDNTTAANNNDDFKYTKSSVRRLKTQKHYMKKLRTEIILIPDSDDDDELPSLKTMLKNITNFTIKKINRKYGAEFIEMHDDTTAANNNDDFTYTTNKDRSLGISKKETRAKLKSSVRRLKTQKTYMKKLRTEIILIPDSDDDDELPPLKTVLENIPNFSNNKINKKYDAEFIEIHDDTTAANNNNGDFTYTINKDRSLNISKKEIRAKLKNLVRRLKTKEVTKHIIDICEYKEKYEYYNNFKSLSELQLHHPLAIMHRSNNFVPRYYVIKGFTIMYEHLMLNPTVWKPKVGDINKKFMEEVIIPELGVWFIMEDLGVNDYDTAIKITRESVEYGSEHFFGDDNDKYFW